MSEKNGGPAFPIVGMQQHGDQSFVGVFKAGMSLRDYFAAKSMHATISKLSIVETGDGIAEKGAIRGTEAELRERFDKVAGSAYAMADAMLKARQS